MPLFCCFQSSYLEVMFSLGCTVLCLLWGGDAQLVLVSPHQPQDEKEVLAS